MALLHDRCICLCKVEYSETSQILLLFSRDYGLQRVVAKGAHRTKYFYDSDPAFSNTLFLWARCLRRMEDVRCKNRSAFEISIFHVEHRSINNL